MVAFALLATVACDKEDGGLNSTGGDVSAAEGADAASPPDANGDGGPGSQDDVALAPGDGALPVADASVPALDAAVPSLDAAVPSLDAAVPALDAAVPALDAAVPAPDAALPLVDAALPLVDAALPLVDVAVPLVDAALPLVDVAVPLIDAALPLIDAVVPLIDVAVPLIDAAVPALDAPIVAIASCGNAVREDHEACDDGNVLDHDFCSDLCRVEACGDGVVQLPLGENCDDGNLIAGDGCAGYCAFEPFALTGPVIIGEFGAGCSIASRYESRRVVIDDGGRFHVGLICEGLPFLATSEDRGFAWDLQPLGDSPADELTLAAGANGNLAAAILTTDARLVLHRTEDGGQTFLEGETLSAATTPSTAVGLTVRRRDVYLTESDGLTRREHLRLEGSEPTFEDRRARGALSGQIFDRASGSHVVTESGEGLSVSIQRPGRSLVSIDRFVPDGTLRVGFGAQRFFFARRDGVTIRPFNALDVATDVPFPEAVDTRDLRMSGGAGGVVYLLGRAIRLGDALVLNRYDVALDDFGPAYVWPVLAEAFDFAPLPDDGGALFAWDEGGEVKVEVTTLARLGELPAEGEGGGPVIGFSASVGCPSCPGIHLGYLDGNAPPHGNVVARLPSDGEPSNAVWNPAMARAAGTIAVNAYRTGSAAYGQVQSSLSGYAQVNRSSGGQGHIGVTFGGIHGRSLITWPRTDLDCVGGFVGFLATSTGTGHIHFHTLEDGHIDFASVTAIAMTAAPLDSRQAVRFEWWLNGYGDAFGGGAFGGGAFAGGTSVLKYDLMNTHSIYYYDAINGYTVVAEADNGGLVPMPRGNYTLSATFIVESMGHKSHPCDDLTLLSNTFSSAISLLPTAAYEVGHLGAQFVPEANMASWVAQVEASTWTGGEQASGGGDSEPRLISADKSQPRINVNQLGNVAQ